MTHGWPGQWVSGAEKQTQEEEPGFTNDHGTLYLVGDNAREFMWVDGIPPHLENRC